MITFPREYYDTPPCLYQTRLVNMLHATVLETVQLSRSDEGRKDSPFSRAKFPAVIDFTCLKRWASPPSSKAPLTKARRSRNDQQLADADANLGIENARSAASGCSHTNPCKAVVAWRKYACTVGWRELAIAAEKE